MTVHAKRPQKLHEPDEIAVDRAIHVIGIFAGALGSAALIWLARDQQNQGGEWWPIIVYSACLMAMLCCSAAYNLSGSSATPRNTSACRPRSNLPSDRRHIHAVHHPHAARKMEFLDDQFDLGVSVIGRSFQAGLSALGWSAWISPYTLRSAG